MLLSQIGPETYHAYMPAHKHTFVYICYAMHRSFIVLYGFQFWCSWIGESIVLWWSPAHNSISLRFSECGNGKETDPFSEPSTHYIFVCDALYAIWLSSVDSKLHGGCFSDGPFIHRFTRDRNMRVETKWHNTMVVLVEKGPFVDLMFSE